MSPEFKRIHGKAITTRLRLKSFSRAFVSVLKCSQLSKKYPTSKVPRGSKVLPFIAFDRTHTI